MPDRIQKILSAYGLASRRAAERMIIDGRVLVNGIPATLGQSADAGKDTITVDGKPLANKSEQVYIMLNKPRGFLTTKSDDRGRKTVMSLIADAGLGVYPVGRLDMWSEGLLLLTNDGKFANSVAHPSYNKKKVYEVHMSGDVRRTVELLRQPIEIDSHTVKAEHVELSNITTGGGVIRITIIEGRNRQIRRMCAACGVRVKTLKRVSIGALRLGSLEPGKWRYLTGEEVQALS